MPVTQVTDEETETQREPSTCPRSHSQGWKPDSPDYECTAQCWALGLKEMSFFIEPLPNLMGEAARRPRFLWKPLPGFSHQYA